MPLKILRIPNEVAYAKRGERFTNVPINEFLGFARALVLEDPITNVLKVFFG